MEKLTKEQALIITGYTGYTCCNFGDFQLDAEKRLGRSIFTHEFGTEEVRDELKEVYRDDFLAMCVD